MLFQDKKIKGRFFLLTESDFHLNVIYLSG